MGAKEGVIFSCIPPQAALKEWLGYSSWGGGMAKHDYLSDRAANYKLMQDIRNWWSRRGQTVRVWLEKANDPSNGTVMWVIRTDLRQDVAIGLRGHSVG
jgi:hypothetical protein